MLSLGRLVRRFTQLPNVTKSLIRYKSSETLRDLPAVFPARSWLFAAKTRKGFVKASQSRADVIVLDLEDSVPQELKAKMLQEYVTALRDGIFKGKRVFVRLCGLENSKELAEQVEQLTTSGVCGYLIPKTEDLHCLREYENLVENTEKRNNLPLGTVKFVPLLESASTFFNVEEVVNGSSRNVGVVAGTADFRADAHCDEDSTTCDAFLSQVVIAAKVAQILPISGVNDKIDDHAGSEKFFRKMKASGFGGAATLTPSQAIQANIAFSYSPKELGWAKAAISGDSLSILQPSVQESRQMIGPPHRLIASRIICEQNRIIQGTSSSSATAEPRLLLGRMPLRGLSEIVQIGRTVRCPLELTVTESWKALWESAFLTVDRLGTSSVFASKLGLKAAPLPFTLVNTLALALAVASFSETARVHLGCYGAVQKKPVYPGDTLSSVYRIDDAKSTLTKGGSRYTVVQSSHHLVNQENQAVFSVQKRTMFAPLKIENLEQDSVIGGSSASDYDSPWRQFITSQPTELLYPTTAPPPPSLSPGELILHNDYKCFGLSETRMLCKLFKISNPHHHNIVRYSSSEILVPGPFVIAAMVSNTVYDVGDVIYEEYPMHTNINKVNPGDQIGTLTMVESTRRLDENPELEEVTLKHIGVKNVDLEWLLQTGVPEDLFGDELQKPAQYEKMCAVHCPLLYHKIACQATRKIIRVSPEACPNN